MRRRITSIAATALLALSTSVLQAGTSRNATAGRPGEGDAKLRDLEFQAAALQKEADQFIPMTSNPKLSPESHEMKLDTMKDEINSMGREMQQLESERDTLPAWEQQALDKTMPFLKDSATNLQNAINFYNDNRTHLWIGDSYRNSAEQIYKDAERMEKALKTYRKLEKTHTQEQHLNEAATSM